MKKTALVVTVILSLCAFSIFAQESGDSPKLIDTHTLNDQIEKVSKEVDKKQEQEKQEDELLRTKLKEEAIKKDKKDLYHIVNVYVAHKKYAEAIKVYEQILVIDPGEKEEVEKKIDSCASKLKSEVEEQMLVREKEKEKEQKQLARQLVTDKERKDRQEIKEAQRFKNENVKQHLDLGDKYMANKNYLLAIDEFEKALIVDPSSRAVMTKLAKAQELLYKKEPSKNHKIEDINKRINYDTLIRDGFKEALKYLEGEEYQKAQEEFAKILENIGRSNLESLQLKTVKQIKDSVQKGPEEILSYIRSDKYDEAKTKLWELIQKTVGLSRQKEERAGRERRRLLVDGYLKNASEYLANSDYMNTKLELQRAIVLDPTNQEATSLLDRLEDVISITAAATDAAADKR